MKRKVIPIKIRWGDDWGVDLGTVEHNKGEQIDYLSRADKIYSLKREVKRVKRRQNPLFSKIKPTSDSIKQDFKKVLAREIKYDVMDSNFCQNMNHVGRQYFKEFDIVRLDDEQVTPLVRELVNKSSKKGWKSVFRLIFTFGNTERVIYMTEKGCKGSRNGHSWTKVSNLELLGYSYDLYDFFENLLMIDYINREIKDEKEYYNIHPEDLLGGRMYYKEMKDNREYPSYFCNIPVFASSKEAEEVLGQQIINVASISDAELEYLINGQFIPNGFDYSLSAVPFRRLALSSDLYSRALEETLKRIAFRYYAERGNRADRERAEKEYALSFETKKNIPKKTVEAMSNSKFNDYFGFVEFDELTDLNKIIEIENEFRCFMRTVFGEIKQTKNIALRFRRLGHHKASGLYYPTMGCICIDIGTPSSFVHEYGHMIDYEFNTEKIPYSESNSFRGLFFLYCSLFEENIKDKKDKLKGKYNVKYYETPTEVFARCFEIFVHRIIGMNNSIIGECAGFAYPEDKELEKMINDYFTEILCIDQKRGEEKCAST